MGLQRKTIVTIFLFVVAATLSARTVAAQTEGAVKRDGFDLHYRIIGKGLPILLLSGGPGIDVGYLTPVAQELGKTYQCILLEQRGTGRSRPKTYSAANVNLKLCLDDLEALRTALKLEKWSLLGHSWGGMLGMAYAGAHPERVDMLVLASSGGMTLEFFEYFSDNIHLRLHPSDLQAERKWANPALRKANPARASMEDLKAVAPGYFFNRQNVKKLTANIRLDTLNSQVFQLLIQDLAKQGYDLRPALKMFTRPVLIVQGRQDPIGESTAYETKKTLVGASLQFINRCGHFPWMEQPGQFYAILTKFLKQSRT
jgi:proline iminopeptidase